MTEKRIQITLDTRQAQSRAKSLDRGVRNIGRSVDGVSESSKRATFSVNRLAAAISSIIAVNKISSLADAFTQVENQVRRTVSSEEDLVRTTAELLSVANDTRAGLLDTTKLYTSLSVSTKSLGISQSRLIGVTKTVNNLFLEGGKSSAETAGAIRQLGQALESGALRGDEFNSVAEGAPGILRAIEKQTGKTRAELRALAATGGITAELLVGSLENYSKAAQEAADKTKSTLAQSFTIASNNASAFLGANMLVQESMSATGTIVVGLSENLDTLVKVAGAAAALYVARLIPSALSYTSALTLQVGASLRATTVTNAMGVVVGRTTLAMNAAALASRGLAAGLSILGGPLGLIFLTVTAFAAYSSSVKSASSATDVLSESTDNLTKAQADNLKLRTEETLAAERDRIIDLNVQIENATNRWIEFSKGSNRNIKAQKDLGAEIKKTRIELALAEEGARKLEDRLGTLGDVISGRAKTEAETESAVPAFTFTEPTKKTGSKSKADSSVSNAQSDTATLQRELNLRRQITDIYLESDLGAKASQYEKERALQIANEQENEARLAAKLSEDAARREEQFLLSLENDALEDEQKKILRAEYDSQNLIAAQIFESELTSIQEDGAKARSAIDIAEKNSRIDSYTSFANSGLKLFAEFGSKSAKQQKRVAILESGISIVSATAKALNNPYPANLGFAAQVAVQGAGLISKLKGMSSGSASVPQISASASSSSSPAPSSTSSGVEAERAPTVTTAIFQSDGVFTGEFINDKLNELSRNGGIIAGQN